MTEEVTLAVDSGMNGEAVQQAEWFWANLPTGRKWAGLATHEKALVCHQIARIANQPPAQSAITPEWCLNMAKKEGDSDIGAGLLARDPAPQPPAQDGKKVSNDYPAIGGALERLLDGQHILRAWRCFDGGYMVAVCQNDYWAPSIKEALEKALASLGDKP